MVKTKVVVLSGHSLFADGTASRLAQHSGDVETIILDPAHRDIIKKLVTFNPSVAIVDTKDPNLCKCATLSTIFRAIPDLRVVILDSQAEDIQVLTSRAYQAAAVSDLIRIFADEEAQTKP